MKDLYTVYKSLSISSRACKPPLGIGTYLSSFSFKILLKLVVKFKSLGFIRTKQQLKSIKKSNTIINFLFWLRCVSLMYLIVGTASPAPISIITSFSPLIYWFYLNKCSVLFWIIFIMIIFIFLFAMSFIIPFIISKHQDIWSCKA